MDETCAGLAGKCAAGDVRAVARLITGLENDDREAYAALNRLVGSGVAARVIGVTGPPGSGKSTLADKLVAAYRAKGRRVGVLAVDPSSPFSGGAILGDRLRMQRHATDPDVYIRSLASRGALGGISRVTGAAVQVLEAAGYDTILIETVGVGQSEIDIVKIADCVVLVSVPGLGDEIQILKAGIMEIGDIFVVNKADRGGADRVVREIRAMLETQYLLAAGREPDAGPDTLAGRAAQGEMTHHHLSLAPGAAVATPVELHVPEECAAGQNDAGRRVAERRAVEPRGTEPQGAESPRLPPVLKTTAESGEGIPELVEAIDAHFALGVSTGSMADRRFARARTQLGELVAAQVVERVTAEKGSARLDDLAAQVVEHRLDLHSASQILLRDILKGENDEGTQT